MDKCTRSKNINILKNKNTKSQFENNAKNIKKQEKVIKMTSDISNIGINASLILTNIYNCQQNNT